MCIRNIINKTIKCSLLQKQLYDQINLLFPILSLHLVK